MLTFDEASHTYRWNDVVVPSVTQALQEWIKVELGRYSYYVHTVNGAVVNAETFEAAGDFGTAIHKACALILLGTLDWDTIDESLIPCLIQFEKWLDDFKVVPQYHEFTVYSKKYGYAGTFDLRGTLLKNESFLVDFKTGSAYDMVAPQTAAYDKAFIEFTSHRKAINRYVLHLPKDGNDYKFKRVERKGDFQFFLNRLSQWRYHNQGA